jgi:chromosomal replication initiation ATPase DnaA
MREQVDLRMQAHQKRRAFEAKVRALAANVCQGNEPAANNFCRTASDTTPSTFLKPLWMRIVEEVSEKHRVTIRRLMSPGRGPRFVRARWEMYYRLHTERKMSMNEIARRTNKDHTTVMNGIRKYKKELERETQKDAAGQS